MMSTGRMISTMLLLDQVPLPREQRPDQRLYRMTILMGTIILLLMLLIGK